MRRRGSGLLLPAFVLTALAVAGVLILLAVGAPVVPRGLPGFPVNDSKDARRSVRVAPSPESSSGAPRPSASGTPAPTPTGSVAGPTVAPTTAGPGEPRTSSSPAATRSATPKPTRTATQPPPPPPPPSCKAGSATLTPSADTYVDQASPAQSFGGSETLQVASRDKSRNRRALVRFALPAIPSGCTLRSAAFTLTAREATGRRVLVSRAGRSWTESTTWNTAPSPSGATVGMTVSSTTVTWTVTSLVAAITSGGNYGFVVRDASEGARGAGALTNFNARTTRSAPTLALRWS